MHSCVEACALLFGGAHPALTAWEGSVSSASASRTCHADMFGQSCNEGPFADDYKVGAAYDTAGAVRGAQTATAFTEGLHNCLTGTLSVPAAARWHHSCYGLLEAAANCY